MPTIATGVVHTIPTDLKEILITKPKILDLWNALTPLARNEWICFLISVKYTETRKKHLIRLQNDLLNGKKRPCCWVGCSHRDREQ